MNIVMARNSTKCVTLSFQLWESEVTGNHATITANNLSQSFSVFFLLRNGAETLNTHMAFPVCNRMPFPDLRKFGSRKDTIVLRVMHKSLLRIYVALHNLKILEKFHKMNFVVHLTEEKKLNTFFCHAP